MHFAANDFKYSKYFYSPVLVSLCPKFHTEWKVGQPRYKNTHIMMTLSPEYDSMGLTSIRMQAFFSLILFHPIT